MFFLPVNAYAIFAAAILCMIIGFVWYMPSVFGKVWMKESGITKKSMSGSAAKTAFAKSFVATLVMVYILSQLESLALVAGVAEGASMGVLVWLGFVATTLVNSVLFEGKSWTLYFINSGYQLVCLLLAGIILAVWI